MGPKKQGFCSKINCIQMKLLYFINRYSARASKSAKIVLSKSKSQKSSESRKRLHPNEYAHDRTYITAQMRNRKNFHTKFHCSFYGSLAMYKALEIFLGWIMQPLMQPILS